MSLKIWIKPESEFSAELGSLEFNASGAVHAPKNKHMQSIYYAWNSYMMAIIIIIPIHPLVTIIGALYILF